jgi:hypothetical protein
VITGADLAGDPQVVVVGAGYDSRARRLARDGVHFLARAQRGQINFRPTPGQATGWTPGETLTAHMLIRRYLAGTRLPVTGVRPTAFALTATVE